MPAGWDGIEVESLWIRGRRATLRAYHGQATAQLEYHSPTDTQQHDS